MGDLISYFLVSLGGYLVVWLETANRRFVNGDYDFGVIATLSIARVLCSKSDFMLHKTYLAMNQCSSVHNIMRKNDSESIHSHSQ